MILQADDTGLLGESPYIGRARYKANRLASETEIPGASPSQAHLHSIQSPQRADIKMEINHKLDHEIARKQEKVAKGRLFLAVFLFKGGNSVKICSFFVVIVF